jgi:hypothetical protein
MSAAIDPQKVQELAAKTKAAGREADQRPMRLADFYAYLPAHKYLYVPTRDLWPAESVDGAVPWPENAEGQRTKPSRALDATRPLHQMTWAPGEPQLIVNRIVADGGWIGREGNRVFNLYRPPAPITGDPTQAGPWRDHLARIYPDEAEHIERWLAHRLQRPGEKINHALVLGGAQGIGKDSILDPIKAGVGAWNWQEVSPAAMLGRFNGWAKAVVVRVSEARDLGDVDRFAFYDHSKVYIAAPPDVIRVDEKNLREHPVMNVMGVIITTNHKTDGIYLPDDDRRHFVAWSEVRKEEFTEDYWRRLWGWYAAGGTGHVVAYLRSLDLSGFDPKAPPRRTAAFYAIVQANGAPEDAELADAIERAGNPDALTIEMLIANAEAVHGPTADVVQMLRDRRSRRAVPHKLDRAGYVPVRNPDAADGHWKVNGRRQAAYARRTLSVSTQIAAVRRLQDGRPW